MRKRIYLASVLCLVGLGLAAVGIPQHFAARPDETILHTTLRGAQVSTLARALRPNYPFSVIPGGAYTAAELRSAIARSPELREQYRGFDLEKLRVVKLERDYKAFVSYRQNGRFFWTRRRLTVPAGEILLTDGTNFAKTRCGNRLSQLPHGPVNRSQASEAVLSPPALAVDRLAGLNFVNGPDAQAPHVATAPKLEQLNEGDTLIHPDSSQSVFSSAAESPSDVSGSAEAAGAGAAEGGFGGDASGTTSQHTADLSGGSPKGSNDFPTGNSSTIRPESVAVPEPATWLAMTLVLFSVSAARLGRVRVTGDENRSRR